MVFEFVIDCGMEIVKCNMVWCGRRFNIVSNCSCIVEVHIMKDKAMIIAHVTLFIGIGLLAFTFISAYIFLINNPSITGSSDLIDVFGSSLAPLIEASNDTRSTTYYPTQTPSQPRIPTNASPSHQTRGTHKSSRN